jgi:hypothetical protein
MKGELYHCEGCCVWSKIDDGQVFENHQALKLC